MLLKRFLTAMILVAFLYAVLFLLPPIAWWLTLTLIIALASSEWIPMCQENEKHWQYIFLMFFLVCATSMLTHLNLPLQVITGVGVGVAIYGVIAVYRFEKNKHQLSGLNRHYNQLLLCFLLLVPFIESLIALHEANDHTWLLLITLSTIWVNDSCALFMGRIFGRTPLCKVSPNKTVEGLVGGVIIATIYGSILLHMIFPEIPYYDWGLIVSISMMAANIGDLLVSLMKRIAGVKDTGTLLPGHGGLLDRIDSLLTGLPCFVFLLLFWT